MMGMNPGLLVSALSPFRFKESVGSVDDSVGPVDDYFGPVVDSAGRDRLVESVIFVPTGIKSIGDVDPLVVFVPKGIISKFDQFIEIFLRPKS